jgi:parallel beta-helix repeat protein
VQRDNAVIDGAGHTLQGTGAETGIDLSSRTNVTIQNMVIKTFDDALYLHSSNQITISGTNISDSTDGIRVSDSSNNSIYENNITGNSYEGIYILASSNNTISENNITANTGDGVYLWGSSNNTISKNNITNNWWGITSYYSTNNKIFHNNFINNPSQACIESSVDIWDDGYPSGGNYWNDYVGVDAKNGPSQDHLGRDGIGDTPYVIDGSNQDNYPLMTPHTPHDLAVIHSTTSRTVVGQGYSLTINATVANRGDYTENFNLTVYANETIIETKEVTLSSGNSTTITFTWNTTGFAKGNYTISAYAWPVSGETDFDDNNYTNGCVTITWLGDLDGDFDVDEDDLWHFCGAFIDYYKIHVKDPLCDFDDDCDIDEDDLWCFCGAFIDYWKAH